MELFAKPTGKKRARKDAGPSSSAGAEQEAAAAASSAPARVGEDAGEVGFATTFAELGVCPWLVASCTALGMRVPTPVQRCCVPAALKGLDCMGLAETGSGKTAAFALPMLQRLSEDPYGVFGLVLTPTRELAIQIAEQILALGAPLGVRVCTVIGGVSPTQQSLEIASQPHILVATPGRLIDHLEGPSPPALERLSFLVLDEADRILNAGFAPELTKVLKRLPAGPRRQTLLFSATMSDAIEQLRTMASRSGAKLFDLTGGVAATPASLTLEYLFMPAQVKLTYLVQALRTLVKLSARKDRSDELAGGKGGKGGGGKGGGGKGGRKGKEAAISAALAAAADAESDSDDDAAGGRPKRARSAIVFVGSCARCQEVAQVLLELGVECVCLHSLLDQRRRLAALGKFKSLHSRLLVATDVASRGLDLPDVDLVSGSKSKARPLRHNVTMFVYHGVSLSSLYTQAFLFFFFFFKCI
jgi:ATP-dependent RNA helicase DDX49/DBP8